MNRTRPYPIAIVALLLSLALAAAFLPPLAHAAPEPPRISTQAEGAALIDVASGRLLYSKQGDKRMRIASLTKIMTAIVAIENGRLSDRVKVGASAFGKEGSSIFLKLGEEMSLEHMLYGLMLRSGNDAAVAIAEHVGGSLEGFVLLMNQKAEQLGLANTQFRNPHGLDEEGHYSSPNDMAVLTAYALRNPTFREIVKTKVARVPNPDEPWDRLWHNKNRMLSLYEGADGVKTGYTKLAHRCLVSSATRGGRQLAVVTLNDSDDWLDHRRLLDYGFENYPLTTVIAKGTAVESAPGGETWEAGRTFYYPLSAGESAKLSTQLVPIDTRSASYRLGERGVMKILFDGQTVGAVPLYAPGSPQLKQTERYAQTAYRSGDTAAELTGWSAWTARLRGVLRILLTGEGGESAW
ncbi:D-alanyl-D-alanine carboxypeptidase family protein [Paenibacillus thermoaerophilus]|uniref:D-alanyl-D-alanine carboxypeptidase family protein n=1 Tax=Paenibacillus thermoaerophilus TaxID=1215385 RepID=A0ABW2V9W4_9BACL|nr:D-alanyl-D-alanine carboxypeptidase family protein [Paenibacillus thermoaerophilus]TMV07503.1 D-alanyl-D-alanine carboxypeptidase [Paenibacillus thermoaerophilus]